MQCILSLGFHPYNKYDTISVKNIYLLEFVKSCLIVTSFFFGVVLTGKKLSFTKMASKSGMAIVKKETIITKKTKCVMLALISFFGFFTSKNNLVLSFCVISSKMFKITENKKNVFFSFPKYFKNYWKYFDSKKCSTQSS